MSSLGLMSLYTVIALAMQALCIGVIFLIEPLLGGWSNVVFITTYLLAFWLAWVVAMRVTEPRTGSAEVGQTSRT